MLRRSLQAGVRGLTPALCILRDTRCRGSTAGGKDPWCERVWRHTQHGGRQHCGECEVVNLPCNYRCSYLSSSDRSRGLQDGWGIEVWVGDCGAMLDKPAHARVPSGSCNWIQRALRMPGSHSRARLSCCTAGCEVFSLCSCDCCHKASWNLQDCRSIHTLDSTRVIVICSCVCCAPPLPSIHLLARKLCTLPAGPG
jgi:hypothetical protein